MKDKKYPIPTYQTGVKFLQVEDIQGFIQPGQYSFECPGCKLNHILDITNKKRDFNFDFFKPIINPSFLIKTENINKTTICHFLIRNGRFEYLNDCTHNLSGKTIDMLDVVKV